MSNYANTALEKLFEYMEDIPITSMELRVDAASDTDENYLVDHIAYSVELSNEEMQAINMVQNKTEYIHKHTSLITIAYRELKAYMYLIEEGDEFYYNYFQDKPELQKLVFGELDKQVKKLNIIIAYLRTIAGAEKVLEAIVK